MKDRASIQWQYYPVGLFESHFILEVSDGVLAFDQGTAEFAYLDRRQSVDDDEVQRITSLVEQVLNAQSVARGLRHSIETPSKHLVDDHGNRTIQSQASVGLSVGLTAQFRVFDKTGKLLRDSRAEAQERSTAQIRESLAVATRFPEIHALHRSYAASLADPGHSLVHLYEVLETLEKVLGSRANVAATLGVGRLRVGELGRLANDAPLLEGRHRGVHFTDLRPATAEEIALAKSIALELIQAYINYRK
jgi:hypothetical protein